MYESDTHKANLFKLSKNISNIKVSSRFLLGFDVKIANTIRFMKLHTGFRNLKN